MSWRNTTTSSIRFSNSGRKKPCSSAHSTYSQAQEYGRKTMATYALSAKPDSHNIALQAFLDFTA